MRWTSTHTVTGATSSATGTPSSHDTTPELTHDTGDILLARVAKLIKAQARDVDTVCRCGGEEFLVFLRNTNMSQAKCISERIRRSVESHEYDGIGNVTISIGIAHWDGEGELIDRVIKNADDALYQAKRNGRNRTELSGSN